MSGPTLALVLCFLVRYHSAEQMARRDWKECHSGNWWRGKNLVYVDSCQPGHWHPNWSHSPPLIFPAATAASLSLSSRSPGSEYNTFCVECPNTESLSGECGVARWQVLTGWQVVYLLFCLGLSVQWQFYAGIWNINNAGVTQPRLGADAAITLGLGGEAGAN